MSAAFVPTREGFYKWTAETAAAELARFDRAIQKALAILREEDEAEAPASP